MQSSQPLNQLQQQLLLQAQQNLGSPSANDLESRKLNMLLNRNLSFGKDGQLNSVGDVSNVGSPVQVVSPVLPRADPDMLLKVLLFLCLRIWQFLLSLLVLFAYAYSSHLGYSSNKCRATINNGNSICSNIRFQAKLLRVRPTKHASKIK